MNLYLAGRSIALILDGDPGGRLGAVRRGRPAAEAAAISMQSRTTTRIGYSPLFAAFFGLVVPMGVVGWRLLHLVAVLALPSMPMRLLGSLRGRSGTTSRPATC